MQQQSSPEPLHELYRRLGDVFLAQEQWQKAVDAYQKAIALHADDGDVYVNLAIALQFLNQHAEAIDVYRMALKHDPTQASIYNNMGRSLAHMNRFEEALIAFEQSLALNPSFALAYYNMGKLLQRKRYHHRAIACFCEVLKRQPHTLIYSELGMEWLSLEEPQRAMAYFRQAVLPQRNLIDAYCRIYQDQVLDSTPDPEDFLGLARKESILFLKALLALDSKSVIHLANAYRYWGDLFTRDGGRSQRQYAEQVYTYALQLNPYLEETYDQLSQCLSDQGRLTAAVLVQHYATVWNAPVEETATPTSSRDREIESQPTAVSSSPSLVESTVETLETLNGCGGLNCRACLQDIWHSYMPKQIASGVYKLGGSGLANTLFPLDVLTLPDGQCWIAPYKNPWQICNVIAVYNQENTWISSRSREYPGQLPNCSQQTVQPERAIARYQHPVERLQGRVAVVSGLSGHVYFHWMVDILPRLELLRQAGINLSTLDGIVVNSQQRSFQRETLKLFGVPDDRIIESDRHPHIQADELIVPSFSGYLGWPQPWTLNVLRDRILPHISTQEAYPERIYISRADATYRKVLNEAELVKHLEVEGFVSVGLAERSVVEQATLFHHAKVIIAAHGSSLTNLVFCRPGTVVIELTSPNYIRPYYWDISRQLGLHHLIAYAEVLSCHPIRQVMSPNPLTEDLWIGTSTVDTILTHLKSWQQNGDARLKITPDHRVQESSMLPYLKEAIASCEKAFQTQADTFQTSRTLGHMLQAQGLFDEAMTWHTLAVHPDPNLAEVYACFGQLYASQRHWDDAIAAYQNALAENDSFAEAHWGLAEVYSRIGDVEAEIRHRQQAIALNPQWNDAESQFLIGNAYLAQQSFEEAIAAYQAVIEQYPGLKEAHYNLGTAFLKAERYQDAIATYQAALDLDADYAPAHHGLGSAFAGMEHYDQAIHHYQRAIALKPDYLTYYQLGHSFRQLQQWADAATAFQHATDLNPDFPWAYHSLGMMYLRLGQPEHAIAPLQKAVHLKPEHPQFRLTLGNALTRVKRIEEAIASYKQAIGLRADAEIELFELGRELRQRGYGDACMVCYQQAIEQDPMQRRAYVELQYMDAKEHHLQGLISLYRRIQASDRSFHPILWSNLGDVLTRKQKIEEAIDSYRAGCYASITATYPEFAQVQWPDRKTHPPDFIIIGATKCGTTSLYQYLNTHSQILLPQRKEVDFFDRQFHLGKDWYLSQFPSLTDEPGFYTGEASPNYFYSVGTETNIHSMFPNIKLIALLRNPVDRAISAYYHRRRHGVESRSLDVAIAEEMEALAHATEEQLMTQQGSGFQNSVFGGLYVYMLKRWFSVFPREQMLILKSENFFKNTDETMQQVYDFLNIPAASTSTSGKYNVGSYSDEESDVRHVLANFFEPHTRRLEDYLQMEFQWD